MASKAKDHTGKKYGKLTGVKNTFEKNTNGSYIWTWQCECGEFVDKDCGNIVYKGGQCKNCHNKLRSEIKSTHGASKSTEYKSWCKIKERCYNPNDHEYANYGAIGFTFDYKDSFEDFISELGYKPDDGQHYTVDRIDNNLGYVKGNMRWATVWQQARNKGSMKNNTSGFHGVCWDNKEHPCGGKFSLYANAQWHDINGKFRKKCFSVKKYGLLEAFALACQYRENIIAELNKQGAGYSDNHGKPKEIV